MAPLTHMIDRGVLELARLYVARSPVEFGRHFAFSEGRRRAERLGRIVARTWYGGALSCDGADFLERNIVFFGEWEPCLSSLIAASLEPGDVFVDVGANIGYYTILASQAVGPSGGCVSIEAMPSTAGILRENIALNRRDNVKVWNVAVTDKPGPIKIFRPDKKNMGASTTVEGRGYTNYDVVDGLALPDILSDEEKARARFVKIDVEGSELNVLEPVLQDIASFREDVLFCVEISAGALRSAGTTLDGLIDRLKGLGLSAYCFGLDHSSYDYLDHRNRQVAEPKPYSALGAEEKARLAGQPHTDIIFARNEAAIPSSRRRTLRG